MNEQMNVYFIMTDSDPPRQHLGTPERQPVDPARGI